MNFEFSCWQIVTLPFTLSCTRLSWGTKVRQGRKTTSKKKQTVRSLQSTTFTSRYFLVKVVGIGYQIFSIYSWDAPMDKLHQAAQHSTKKKILPAIIKKSWNSTALHLHLTKANFEHIFRILAGSILVPANLVSKYCRNLILSQPDTRSRERASFGVTLEHSYPSWILYLGETHIFNHDFI